MMGGVVAFGMSLLVFVWDGPSPSSRTPSTPPIPSSWTRKRDPGPRHQNRTPSTPPIPSSRTRASAIRDLDTRTERLLRPQFRRPGRAQARSGTSTPEPNAFYGPNSVAPDARKRDPGPRHQNRTPSTPPIPSSRTRASAIRDLDTRTERLLHPHPESTDKILEKISPFGIQLLNKRELPGPFPPFQRLFPRYCALHCLVLFVPDQPIDPVLFCEPGNEVIAVFPGALRQIRRHADIQHAVRPACKHVDTRRFPHLTMVHGGTVPLQNWAGSCRDPGYRLRRFRDDGKVAGCSGMTGEVCDPGCHPFPSSRTRASAIRDLERSPNVIYLR